MKITAEHTHQLRKIIDAVLGNDQTWLASQAIDVNVSVVGRFWVLNYPQIPRTPYNRLVRGMVVQQPDHNWSGDHLDLIRSFPFTRFFNHREPDADAVDFSRAEMLEKLDGTMIGVCFPSGKTEAPLWHTRRVIADFEILEPKDRILKAAGNYLQHLAFHGEHASYSFVFELVHHTSFVRTRYRPQDFGLYLIGARHLRSLEELSEDDLDYLAGLIGARRPRRWGTVECEEEIQRVMRVMASETPDFEGFVFRDQLTGSRVKLKDPNYVKALHLAGQASWKSLAPKVLQGEEDEVLAYFPTLKEKVEPIKQRWREYLDHAENRAKFWLALRLEKKLLAQQLFQSADSADRFLCSQIMKLYEFNDHTEIRKRLETSILQLIPGVLSDAGNPRLLVELLRLVDE